MAEDADLNSRLDGVVMRVFAVFSEHGRYGPELRGVFTNRDAAEKLKHHFDATQDGWKNSDGGTIREIQVAETYEQWGQFDA